MSESEMKLMFFNKSLTEINLYDYIDTFLLVDTDTPIHPIEIKSLTKVNLKF
jgi:hypothetical protein